MEEWKEYRLGEICKVINGRAYKQEELLNEGKYKVLRVGNIFQGNKWYYSDLELPDSKYCYNGDLLYAWSCDFAPYIWHGDKTIYHYHIWKLEENKDVVDRQYLYYYLQIRTKTFLGGTHGSVMLHMTKKDMEDQILSLPSLSSQKRIASILSSLDDKIALNRKINSNLEEQAKALFKSWFIDFEPFKDGKFVDSELGKIPEGWKVTTIGDVTDNIKDKVGDRDNIKVLSPITSGQLVLSEDYFSKQVFSNSIAKYIVVKHNDFAYNPARINIGSIGMNEFDFDGCVSPVYVVFRCQKGYEYFFDLYRRTTFFAEEVKKRAIGGVRQTLSYKDLSLIQLVYPPKKVVETFNSIFISLLHTIHSNNVSNKKLEAIRDTLLPRLMSGEIEV